MSIRVKVASTERDSNPISCMFLRISRFTCIQMCLRVLKNRVCSSIVFLWVKFPARHKRVLPTPRDVRFWYGNCRPLASSFLGIAVANFYSSRATGSKIAGSIQSWGIGSATALGFKRQIWVSTALDTVDWIKKTPAIYTWQFLPWTSFRFHR